MINSADEFVALRSSDDQVSYLRAATEPAMVATWLEVIERYPEMRSWVAHNKTIPVEVLTLLAQDPDSEIRLWWPRKIV